MNDHVRQHKSMYLAQQADLAAAEEEWAKERIAEEVAERNEGKNPCDGDYCLGKGLMPDDAEQCGYCEHIEYLIWVAGEPD